MAEKTRNLRVKEQGILWSKSKVFLGTGKKNLPATTIFHRHAGKIASKAVKYIDLWHLKREQILMNVG